MLEHSVLAEPREEGVDVESSESLEEVGVDAVRRCIPAT